MTSGSLAKRPAMRKKFSYHEVFIDRWGLANVNSGDHCWTVPSELLAYIYIYIIYIYVCVCVCVYQIYAPRAKALQSLLIDHDVIESIALSFRIDFSVKLSKYSCGIPDDIVNWNSVYCLLLLFETHCATIVGNTKRHPIMIINH